MKKHILTFLLTLSAYLSFGQEAERQEHVSYDPTFWAAALRLDADQRNKIEAINAQFYEQLKSRPTLTQLQSYLEARQELILGTFHSRQKRKWEKIISTL